MEIRAVDRLVELQEDNKEGMVVEYHKEEAEEEEEGVSPMVEYYKEEEGNPVMDYHKEEEGSPVMGYH